MRIACGEDGAGGGVQVGIPWEGCVGWNRRVPSNWLRVGFDLALRELIALRVPLIRKVRWVVAFAMLAISSAAGQGSKPTEYQVKAVYIYNFSRFVEWPAKPGPLADDFSICVLGQDPFGQNLNSALANVTIAGKKVAVKRISTPQEAESCRVLFISGSEEKRLKQILGVLDGASILTVSDMPEFTDRGGMMQFVWDGDRVRFEVNLATAEHAGLSLSSELLKVAVNVKGSAPRGD
jgi:hypothetical protein